MKFKKSVMIIICALLCTTMLLCSCSVGEGATSQNLNTWWDVNSEYVQSQNLLMLEESSKTLTDKEIAFNSYNDYFIVTTETDDRVYDASNTSYTQSITTHVWDAKSGEEIYKHEGSAALQLLELKSSTAAVTLLEEGAFVVTEKTTATGKEDTYKITLYNAWGDEIATADSQSDVSVTGSESIAVFNGIAYIAKDGEVKEAFNTDFLSLDKYIGMYRYHDKYAYDVITSSLSSTPTRIVVYENYKAKNTYDVPSDAENLSWGILEDGNVFVQYMTRVDPDAEEFDIEMLNSAGDDFDRYTLSSILWNAESGEEDEIKLDFYVFTLYSHSLLEASGQTVRGVTLFAQDAENIGLIKKIENKRIDDSTKDIDAVVLDSSLNIVCNLSNIVSDQTDASIPEMIANDTFIVELKSGENWMISGTGEKLIQLPSYIEFINDKYVASENHIYTIDGDKLTSVISLNDYGYEIVSSTYHVLILKRTLDDGTTAYYTYNVRGTNSSLVEIDKVYALQSYTISATDVSSTHFVTSLVSATETEYILYDAAGTRLLSSNREIAVQIDTDSLLVVTTTNADGDTVVHTYTKK